MDQNQNQDIFILQELLGIARKLFVYYFMVGLF